MTVLYDLPEEAKIDFSKRDNGAVIGITSPRAGNGKSLLSLLLANQMTRLDYGLKVCVLDMDIFDGQLGLMTNNLSPTILNVLDDVETPLIDRLQNSLIFDEKLNIHVLLAPDLNHEVAYLDSALFKEIITALKETFDIIIIDAPSPHISSLTANVMYPLSDIVLSVSSLNRGSSAGLQAWLQEVQEGNPELLKKAGLVMNFDYPNLDTQNMRENLVLPILGIIPSTHAEVAEALHLQDVSVLLRGDTEFAKSIESLACKLFV